MKVHQTLEWLNLLSLGTKGLKPRQQSVCNQGSVTGGGWRGQHLNSQQHSLTTLSRHFVLSNARTLFSCKVYTDGDQSSQPPPPRPAVPVRQVILPAAVPARPAGILSSGWAGWGGQKPVSEGRQAHRGDTHTPDRQQHHTHKRQKFRPKSSKGATKKNFWPNFG